MTVRELKQQLDDFIAGMDGDVTEDTEVHLEMGPAQVRATHVLYAQQDAGADNELVMVIAAR